MHENPEKAERSRRPWPTQSFLAIGLIAVPMAASAAAGIYALGNPYRTGMDNVSPSSGDTVFTGISQESGNNACWGHTASEMPAYDLYEFRFEDGTTLFGFRGALTAYGDCDKRWINSVTRYGDIGANVYSLKGIQPSNPFSKRLRRLRDISRYNRSLGVQLGWYDEFIATAYSDNAPVDLAAARRARAYPASARRLLQMEGDYSDGSDDFMETARTSFEDSSSEAVKATSENLEGVEAPTTYNAPVPPVNEGTNTAADVYSSINNDGDAATAARTNQQERQDYCQQAVGGGSDRSACVDTIFSVAGLGMSVSSIALVGADVGIPAAYTYATGGIGASSSIYGMRSTISSVFRRCLRQFCSDQRSGALSDQSQRPRLTTGSDEGNVDQRFAAHNDNNRQVDPLRVPETQVMTQHALERAAGERLEHSLMLAHLSDRGRQRSPTGSTDPSAPRGNVSSRDLLTTSSGEAEYPLRTRAEQWAENWLDQRIDESTTTLELLGALNRALAVRYSQNTDAPGVADVFNQAAEVMVNQLRGGRPMAQVTRRVADAGLNNQLPVTRMVAPTPDQDNRTMVAEARRMSSDDGSVHFDHTDPASAGKSILTQITSRNGRDPAYTRARNADSRVKIEEPNGQGHPAEEKVSALAIRPGRILDRDDNVVGETGTFEMDNNVSNGSMDSTRVILSREYQDPVVFTQVASGLASFQGRDPVWTRVTNVETGSFTVTLEEDGSPSETHPATETISYMVFEKGRHVIRIDVDKFGDTKRSFKSVYVARKEIQTTRKRRAMSSETEFAFTTVNTRRGTDPVFAEIDRWSDPVIPGRRWPVLQEPRTMDGWHTKEYVADLWFQW